MTKRLSLIFFIILIPVSLVFFFNLLSEIKFIQFSDAAKFADIARNIVNGGGYTSNFSFFNSQALGINQFTSVSKWIPPAMPLAIAGFFKVFGISDLSVVLTSSIFYFGLVSVTFLLGKKLWGNLVGFLAAASIASNVNFLEYAVSGASETLFALEIILVAYLFIFRKRWTNIFGFFVLILMYLTRPQAIIYIFGLIFLYFLVNYSLKKALSYTAGLIIVGSVAFLTTSKQGLFAVTQNLPGLSPSESLRGAVQDTSLITIFKKVFYNLYNFYRLLPQIASPYMWGLFAIGIFKWSKSKAENSLKVATLFMVGLTFLVAAITIPFYRYLHPVIPLVYLFATATLVGIVKSVVSVQWSVFSVWVKNRTPFTVHSSQAVALIATLLILFFVVGQTLGVIFLDSRFEANRTNKGKPPVYVQLSWLLRDATEPDDVIVTNLDTWGSWYGERKTIWFPLEPNQLDVGGEENPFDAIYLTSYLIDDENYYMGNDWRQIFNNPENPENEFIAENYELKGIYDITSNETYEKQDARAVLLVRKEMK